jgi:sugar phosphate isomerase/epimerase
MGRVAELGLPTCQVGWRPLGEMEIAHKVRRAADAVGVEITTLWAALPGRAWWDFVRGPITLGLVPPAYRVERIKALQHAAHVAVEIGVPSITTDAGFLPEYPNDPLYREALVALKEVAEFCQSLGLEFWLETGPETPITLLRTIEELGRDQLGINLDPANLLMYGKGNPTDAVDILGSHVRALHAKDGEYPTDVDHLGKEKRLGEGRVDFPLLFQKLKAHGFRGAVTIEREVSGEQQIADIRHAIDYLTPML